MSCSLMDVHVKMNSLGPIVCECMNQEDLQSDFTFEYEVQGQISSEMADNMDLLVKNR